MKVMGWACLVLSLALFLTLGGGQGTAESGTGVVHPVPSARSAAEDEPENAAKAALWWERCEEEPEATDERPARVYFS